MKESIALGLGNNVDYEIKWDDQIIESLAKSHRITSRDLHPVERIATLRDLLSSILFFMKDGIGTERYVESLHVITDFAANFTIDITMGGTALRAAIAMSRIGVPSSVHLVTINHHVRKLMPAGCSWYCSNSVDSLYPHLIVQYEKGARVKAGDIDITAPVSTRLIYVNDHDNGLMKLEPSFFENARTARACLISGFNAMRDGALLQQRVQELAGYLKKLPTSVTVFYEDAAFHTEALRSVVEDALSPLIDIFSLNEDELQTHVRKKIDILNPEEVLDALHALHALIPVPHLIVHTRHWALASGRGSVRFAMALEHGTALAATRFGHGDVFSQADFQMTRSFPPQKEGAAFAKEINYHGRGGILCLPTRRIEEKKVTTIGLGDAFVGGFLSTLGDSGV